MNKEIDKNTKLLEEIKQKVGNNSLFKDQLF